jgi:hypothetical protein
MTPAHTLAAQAYLGILLHMDKDFITRNSLEDFTLAKYAAEHWTSRARFEDVSRKVEDVLKRLFNPSKPHLSVSVWTDVRIFGHANKTHELKGRCHPAELPHIMPLLGAYIP